LKSGKKKGSESSETDHGIAWMRRFWSTGGFLLPTDRAF
jgi:hypothetical protein